MMRLRVGASLQRGVRRLSSRRPVVELLGLEASTPNDVVRRAYLQRIKLLLNRNRCQE